MPEAPSDLTGRFPDAGASAVHPDTEGGPAASEVPAGGVQQPLDGVAAPRRRPLVRPVVRGLLVYAAFCAVIGAVAGMVWHAAVRLPAYVVSADGGAATTERGLTRFFVTDAWFCLMGLLCGLLLGSVAWWLFRRLGWVVTVVALVGSMVAALVAWRVGTAFGPHHFAQRVSRASAGTQVPIDFRLRSTAALLVWPLAGDLAVLLFSALGRDADDVRSRAWRWARAARRPRATSSSD